MAKAPPKPRTEAERLARWREIALCLAGVPDDAIARLRHRVGWAPAMIAKRRLEELETALDAIERGARPDPKRRVSVVDLRERIAAIRSALLRGDATRGG